MKKYNKDYIFLFILLVIQTVLFIFAGSKKIGFHMDEVYSYGLANSYKTSWAVIEEGKEYGKDEILADYVNVNTDKWYDYTIVWRNQSADVHPPLYYVLLHTLCSIMARQKFSMWPGLLLNIILAMFVSILFYLLAREMLEKENENISRIITVGFAFSLGITNMVMLTRMYTLLTCWCLALCILYVKALKGINLNRKFYISNIIICMGGLLTQYYFFDFCIFYGTRIVSVIVVPEKME